MIVSRPHETWCLEQESGGSRAARNAAAAARKLEEKQAAAEREAAAAESARVAAESRARQQAAAALKRKEQKEAEQKEKEAKRAAAAAAKRRATSKKGGAPAKRARRQQCDDEEEDEDDEDEEDDEEEEELPDGSWSYNKVRWCRCFHVCVSARCGPSRPVAARRGPFRSRRRGGGVLADMTLGRGCLDDGCSPLEDGARADTPDPRSRLQSGPPPPCVLLATLVVDMGAVHPSSQSGRIGVNSATSPVFPRAVVSSPLL
jgi:hypothetical protein